jgi:hypothetical protein
MAIERAFLFLLRNTSNVLPNAVENISGVSEVFEFMRLQHSLFNIQIAQKNVTKDIYFGVSRASFNPAACFQQQAINTLVAGQNETTIGQCLVKFETPFVLPPDLEFEVALQIPAISALPVAGSWRLGLALDGLGGIYDPSSNL